MGRFKRPWFQSYSGRVTFERFDRAAVAQHGAVRAVGDLVPTRVGSGRSEWSSQMLMDTRVKLPMEWTDQERLLELEA